MDKKLHSFMVKIKAGTLDGLVSDRKLWTNILLLAEGRNFSSINKATYLFVSNRGNFPVGDLGEPISESFGSYRDRYDYREKHILFLDYSNWTQERAKTEMEELRNIEVHLENKKFIKGDESLLKKYGIEIVKEY